MSFINYSDDEVRVFHPLCEEALNYALERLDLASSYEVKHHFRYDGIIPDFVIVNKQNGSILLIVEVKRSAGQVMSTRYRLQSQSYITNAGSQRFERKYFALTNLEKTYLFKYDSQNTSVMSQIVTPSPINTGSFSNSENVFREQLIEDYTKMIKTVYDDTGRYLLNYDEILQELSKYTNDISEWHSAVTVIGFELIRSILKNFQIESVEDWSHAITYRRNPKMMQRLINAIDFESLGDGDINNGSQSSYWNAAILGKAALIGNRTYSGDEFASAVHEILVKVYSSQGIVPTDMELAAALIELVSDELNDPKSKTYCDPAAGSGNLLSAVIDKYQDISPKNIWANDNLEYLKDILTVRFGLKFPRIITPTNAPKISSKNVVALSKSDFENVDAIIMNPPYVSGVRDSERKQYFFNKIRQMTQRNPITFVGQMPLEGPFLELIVNFVKEGTIIGVIFPEQHLFGKGPESNAIRKLLVGEFGLKKIFTYPRTGLFEDVIKGTVILIGEKGRTCDTVEIINSSLSIEEIDIHSLVSDDQDLFGINKRLISIDSLNENISEGWKTSMYPSYNRIFDTFLDKISLLDREKYSRGPADNSGEGKYLYITKQGYWESVKSLVPHSWLKEGIQNVNDYSVGKLVHSNQTLKALCPPLNAFVEDSEDNKLLLQILETASLFLNNRQVGGNQPRTNKTPKEIANLLKRVSNKVTPAGKLLIPRALRNDFKIFETTKPTIVSTNFIILDLTPNEKEIFLSWLMSIFGQIQIEMLAKPQEGMRKIEINEVGLTKFPKNIANLTTRVMNDVGYTRSFADYSVLRKVDEFWKAELNVSDSDYMGLINLMSKLIDLRNP
ncbi:BpuSI family type II restriction endonuclease [Lactococcus garvieae]|uniref:BpuSI family type II restriction endonuclease n=1 Tax=Lactococcus garvieae TaxID=1363 RepID=UPI00254A5D89|nr:BpuSI family type II restriction endonuclease [Lactococcus garvieae]